MTAGGLVIPFFNVFFLREHGMAVGRIGVLFGVAQAVTALAVFGGGWLVGRTGPRRMLLAWSVPFGPLLWSLALVTAAPLAVALFVVQGFVPAATNPLIDQLLLELTPPDRYGAVSTWRNAATELSGLWGAAVGGVLLEATSFGTLFGLAGCVALVGVLGLGWALGRMPAAPVTVTAVSPARS
jgi:MFS family permease